MSSREHSTLINDESQQKKINPQQDPRGASLAFARSLCIVGIIFASGDVWPVVRIGFTFRLAQLCVLTAALICLFTKTLIVRSFAGFKWAYGFLIWIALTLPLSLLMVRSIGYVVWAVTDFLIVQIIVQCFDNEQTFKTLIDWFTASFSIISTFGVLQLILGVMGHPVLITEWWIKGVLPRVNGLSYEPSYYATYLIAGWIFSNRLLEEGGEYPSRAAQKFCFWSATVALIICGSRMGWLMMILWASFRRLRQLITVMVRWRIKKSVFRRVPLFVAAVVALLGVGIHYRNRIGDDWTKVDFLLRGLDLVDHSSASSGPRIEQLRWTLEAIAEHPVFGSGIGALPVVIAPHEDAAVWDLKEAKQHEGMSIIPEIFASTGLVGGFLIVGFALCVFQRYQLAIEKASRSGKAVLSALAWGVIWMLLMLQMNQNFLRIYLFVDLAVLLCCCEIIIRDSRAFGNRQLSNADGSKPDEVNDVIEALRRSEWSAPT